MNEAEFLIFHQACLGREEEEEVLDTLRSGWLTTGPKTKRFEKEFADFVGVKHAIGVNSCTAAMHLSLVALGIGRGDEVITTPITFPATANVIVHQGATPVFVDVEPDTLNLDPAKIEEKITSRTKAIMPVHFAGHPCDMERIIAIAKRNNLHVISDAAHAVESEYRGKNLGQLTITSCYSFYATKNITTGEGGMLVTDNDELAEKFRILSLHGISRDAWKRYSSSGYQHWETLAPGYKYNMYDIQAALGLHQLRKIDEFWEIRKRYAEIYNEAFKADPDIITPTVRDEVKSAYHLYVIQLNLSGLKVDRDTVMMDIQSRNIGVGVHFRALHLQPYYRDTFGFSGGMFPNAEHASLRIISLPLYPKMTRENVDRVVASVKSVMDKHRK